jgi:hypothetical protein
MARERHRDQTELDALKALDLRIRGDRPEDVIGGPAPPNGQWDRSLEEEIRRAKIALAIQSMRADREARHAETTAVLTAIAEVLGIDPARMLRDDWARADVGELVFRIRQRHAG